MKQKAAFLQSVHRMRRKARNTDLKCVEKCAILLCGLFRRNSSRLIANRSMYLYRSGDNVCFGVYRTAATQMRLCCADASTHWLESPLYKAQPRGFGRKLQMILQTVDKKLFSPAGEE